jgi:hypothetical protein
MSTAASTLTLYLLRADSEAAAFVLRKPYFRQARADPQSDNHTEHLNWSDERGERTTGLTRSAALPLRQQPSTSKHGKAKSSKLSALHITS